MSGQETTVSTDDDEVKWELKRITYWSNGLVTDREMVFPMDRFQEFVREQKRRVSNGPGINKVDFYTFRDCLILSLRK